MLGRRKENGNGKGFDLLGKRKEQEDTPIVTPESLATAARDSPGPRMYRTDSAMASTASTPRAPMVEAPRRAADVTAVTGRRAEVQPQSCRNAVAVQILPVCSFVTREDREVAIHRIAEAQVAIHLRPAG